MSKITPSLRPPRPLQGPARRQLIKDKLLALTGDGPRTTARWQAAVLRAIGELMHDSDSAREEHQDLRIPFAKALHDLYGGGKSDAELTEMLLLMLEAETLPLLGKGWQ